MNTPRSADDATSAAAFFHGLPVSVCTIAASSRSFARSSPAARPRISPRFGAGVRDHPSAAAAAASTARATSAIDPRATRATTRSSIGDRFSNVSPLDEAAVASLIQWRTVSGYTERVSRSTAESAEDAERSFFSACSAFSAVNVGCFAACSKACSNERARPP